MLYIIGWIILFIIWIILENKYPMEKITWKYEIWDRMYWDVAYAEKDPYSKAWCTWLRTECVWTISHTNWYNIRLRWISHTVYFNSSFKYWFRPNIKNTLSDLIASLWILLFLFWLMLWIINFLTDLNKIEWYKPIIENNKIIFEKLK
jgi:hypothetical protein